MPKKTPPRKKSSRPKPAPAAVPSKEASAQAEANAPPSKGKKSTKTVVQQRVEEVLRIRLDGAMAHEVIQYASEKGWNLGDRQIFNYIAEADGLLGKQRERSRRKLMTMHLARRDAILARAINVADYGTALRILTDSAELLGLYPPKKQDLKLKLKHTGLPEAPAPAIDLAKLSTEELRQLDGLLARSEPEKPKRKSQ